MLKKHALHGEGESTETARADGKTGWGTTQRLPVGSGGTYKDLYLQSRPQDYLS